MSMSQKITLSEILERGISKDVATTIFNEKIIPEISDEKYKNHLLKIFIFALNNDDTLFTKQSVSSTDNINSICEEYLRGWKEKYLNNRHRSALKIPLKNYGERDEALQKRISASTGAKNDILDYYLKGHYLYMSAENMNGAILEEFLADVLEPAGWYWCAGSILRAIDFCYISESDDTTILLQVKNKYNTENSSSSAIRNGTEIEKWYRLTRPSKKEDSKLPLPNWEALHNLIGANDQLKNELTEKKYLEYIENNSTTEIETLD